MVTKSYHFLSFSADNSKNIPMMAGFHERFHQSQDSNLLFSGYNSPRKTGIRAAEFSKPKGCGLCCTPAMSRRPKPKKNTVMNKVALITAGGSGMGADAARRLAQDGFHVAILSSSGKGEALAEELGGLGHTGSNLDPADHQALVDKAMSKWGRVDVLVNSAGHGPKGDILEMTDDDWHMGLDVYLMNVIRPTRIIAPIMAAQGGGTIINISTFAVFEPDPLFPTSGVFRAGLASFTKLFADKHAAQNVRMNNVLPGFIDSLAETDDRRARIPMGRYGKAREVSGLIAYLASDDATYVTGQNIRIDGGLTASV